MTISLLEEFHEKALRCDGLEDMTKFCTSFLKKYGKTYTPHIPSPYSPSEIMTVMGKKPEILHVSKAIDMEYTLDVRGVTQKDLTEVLVYKMYETGLISFNWDKNYALHQDICTAKVGVFKP